MDFDQKEKRLISVGFTHNRVGMDNGRYSFMYHQIDELTPEKLEEFIFNITKTSIKEYIKQDKDFEPFLDIIDEVIDSIEDIDLYKLDKEYLDISYVIVNKTIINLDEIYQLCKIFK